ncbi:hypothetical protein L1887_27484 [Cichorium endivia]|nr:hypothetical protein L1887_27484 [Cichorium endivia]
MERINVAFEINEQFQNLEPVHVLLEQVHEIFREDCRTVDVYESRTKAIVSAAIGGFNGTVFAYGQTNSGKTHTMRGSSVEPGVIPLAVHDLFDMIQQEMDREFLLRMSYMEIYNEEINDLLAPEHRKLQIHESIERGIFVAGLKEEIVTSPKQVLEFMDFGEAHRHIGETNMNLHSSRSHTIFRMIIESRDKAEDEYAESSCDAVRVSVLLSEGAESQGGHVPYRDSKLTRILQPALGGNANTAIICNITLAQIHADETKSSLQFASRALRVTNCVHVNEILTDAALLKRQKKEIEELRAKLQGSHSEHLGDEILNLRNTLLQSELERERIALELEEEKKAQAERDKMLQEQAKKIQNLSSMVLCSSRDEVPNHHKKEKRRDTWCPGKLPKKMMNELPSTIPTQASAMKPVIRSERERGPLLPFEQLVNDNTSNACKKERESKSVGFCDIGLPDPRSLMHVTSRKKASNRKKSLPTESLELTEIKAEYEKLLLEFEAERTTNEIQIDYLTRKLAEANSCLDENSRIYYTPNTDEKLIKSSLETEAILVIKQLQEKISVLEMEKASSMQNLDSVVDLETEKDNYARKKYEELYKELMATKEEANLAHKQLTSLMDEDSEALTKLSTDIQEITFEIQQSKPLFETEYLQSYSAISDLVAEIRSFSSHDFSQIKTLLADYEKVHSCMKAKINEFECEKISMLEMEKASSLQNIDPVVEIETKKDKYEELYMELIAAKEEASLVHEQLNSLMDEDSEALTKLSTNIQEITFDFQRSKTFVDSITSMMDEHLQSCNTLIDDVKSFSPHDFTQIKTLLDDYKKVYSCMKVKIEELEQEKLLMYNKSEDLQKQLEEACLNGENSSRALTELSEHYETETNELITEIRTLENEIAHLSTSVLAKEKESMRKDLEKTKTKLKETESKLRNTIQEKTKLESEKASAEREIKRLHSQKAILERDINKRESTAGRRRDSVLDRSSNIFDPRKGKGFVVNIDQEEYKKLEVLAFEMERTIASLEEQLTNANDENQQVVLRSESLVQEVEELSEKLEFSNSELERLEEMVSSLVRNELEACNEKCNIINEKMEIEKACSAEKSLEIDRLKNDLILLDGQKKISEDDLKSKLETISLDHQKACKEVHKLQVDLDAVIKERDDLAANQDSVSMDDIQIEELQNCKSEQQLVMEKCNEKLSNAKVKVEELTMKLSTLEAKTHSDAVKNNIERCKLRMRLNGAQTRLDGMRVRCKEEKEEKEYMHKKFEDATNKLKEQLVSCRTENMNLKRHLLLKD